MMEASDWACLYLDEDAMQHAALGKPIKSAISSGEISSHQAAASVFLSKEEALRRLKEEFDLDILRSQSESVKSDFFAMGEMEQTDTTPSSATAVTPIDLDAYPLFKRLAYKRASTFERYFCPERNCEIDFTRLDALLRHTKNTHGDGKKGKGRPKGAAVAGVKRKRLAKGKVLGGKGPRDESEDEDEWYSGKGESDLSDNDEEVVLPRKRVRRS